ncbi:MAG: glycosyltransferase [Planctomycetes bacterium]|nr:glycosyltransferase [Planctomycetota bacterium]
MATENDPTANADEATRQLYLIEGRLATMAEQVEVMRQEVVRYRAALRPWMPWKMWARHQVRALLGLTPQLGRLAFAAAPRKLYVPARYHWKPALTSPPLISVVTPSFNQGQFLGATLESVLNQEYPRLEYVVQDGGSTDSTADVLARYKSRLHRAEMRKDNGQSHAINLGFAGTTGEIMAYLNSDDLLLPGALHAVAKFFQDNPAVDAVYGHRVIVNERGAELGRWVLPQHDAEVLTWADYVPQETLFWRRRIWDKVGGIDESFRFAMDWDLLLRFQDAGAKIRRLGRFLGAFRVHSSSKTVTVVNSTGIAEMGRLRRRCHGRDVTPVEVHNAVNRYLWRHSFLNRLYRLGLIRY